MVETVDDKIVKETRVSLSFYRACFLPPPPPKDGDEEGSEEKEELKSYCTSLDSKCNPKKAPDTSYPHTKGVPFDSENILAGYIPGDYNNSGGIYPISFLCTLHNISAPVYTLGTVLVFVCAALQIIVCLNICTSIFQCATQITGLVASVCIGFGIILFGLLPVVFDMYKDILPKLPQPPSLGLDLPLDILGDIFGDLLPIDILGDLFNPKYYLYEIGALLYLICCALVAVFAASMFICCCKCIATKI
eukprot:GHVR01018029.1.p1 GENE.GHVR01018029.1~~GHVR01018029.1.p1  ORF type:complete len:248 (-),score=39.28 GHVR01018029.1:229-972(-)